VDGLGVVLYGLYTPRAVKTETVFLSRLRGDGHQMETTQPRLIVEARNQN
jgi:hypothetical protein